MRRSASMRRRRRVIARGREKGWHGEQRGRWQGAWGYADCGAYSMRVARVARVAWGVLAWHVPIAWTSHDLAEQGDLTNEYDSARQFCTPCAPLLWPRAIARSRYFGAPESRGVRLHRPQYNCTECDDW